MGDRAGTGAAARITIRAVTDDGPAMAAICGHRVRRGVGGLGDHEAEP